MAGFVWLAMENKLPPVIVTHLPWIAFVLTLYAGLTMVCNAPFYSGKSGLSLKNAPFMVIVVGALLFIVVSSNPSLATFTLFCIYALSGYVYQAWLFMTDRPNPVFPSERSCVEEVSLTDGSEEKTQEYDDEKSDDK